MTNKQGDPSSYLVVDDILEEIKNASESGRWIVPLLGAGISADAGIPVTSSIIRYLAKLRYYIRSRAFLPKPKGMKGDNMLDDLHAEYQKMPLLFLKHHGWPDRFQLNEDLLNHLKDVKDNAGETTRLSAVIRDSLDEILKERSGDRVYKLDEMFKQAHAEVKKLFEGLNDPLGSLRQELEAVGLNADVPSQLNKLQNVLTITSACKLLTNAMKPLRCRP